MNNKVFYSIRFDNFKVAAEEMLTGADFRKHYPVETNGLTNWALRSLLIRLPHQTILIDTGFGNKQDDHFFKQYHLNGDYKLNQQLQTIGIRPEDITDVILTHLHFDHCGGCLQKRQDSVVPTFPNARLWIGKTQWDTALNPDPEERDSFLPENILPLPDYYPVQFITSGGLYFDNIDFRIVNGHTKGQLIPVISCGKNRIVFGADLFPSSAHLDLGMNMNYDMDNSLATCEKSDMLEFCIDNKAIIIFQHGFYVECCSLKRTKNIIKPDKLLKIHELN